MKNLLSCLKLHFNSKFKNVVAKEKEDLKGIKMGMTFFFTLTGTKDFIGPNPHSFWFTNVFKILTFHYNSGQELYFKIPQAHQHQENVLPTKL